MVTQTNRWKDYYPIPDAFGVTTIFEYPFNPPIVGQTSKFLHRWKAQTELYNLRNYEVTVSVGSWLFQSVKLLHTNF